MDPPSDESEDFVPLRRFPSDISAKPVPGPPVILVSGPQGVGISGLIDRLIAKHPTKFVVPQCYTTRPPRPNESGRSASEPLRFIVESTFELLNSAHDFVVDCTHAEHCYGVRWGDFLQHQGQGRILVMRAQPENIDSLRRSASIDVMCAFVVPLTLKAHEEKLRKEQGLRGARLSAQMDRAEAEVEFASARRKTDLLMVNDDMELAFLRLEDWALNEAGKGCWEEEAD